MGQLWKACVDFLVENRHELVIAGIFAILGAVVVAALGIDSAVRAGIRHIKNKLAERSISRLKKRIVQLEQSRDIYKSFLSSDKALYLHAFQIVLAILLCGCAGAIIFILGLFMGNSAPNPGNVLPLAMVPFAFAVGLAAWGLKITGLTTREKVAALIEKLDADIAGLNAKL